MVGHPNVQLMTNVTTADGDEGRSAVVPSPYHTDLDYETEPASASMILCHTAPLLGAQTSFIRIVLLFHCYELRRRIIRYFVVHHDVDTQSVLSTGQVG